MTFTLIQGDNRQVLKTLADNSVDAIVTDPPYGISFLGKDWDSFKNSNITKNSTIKNLGSGMRMTTHTENLNFQIWCEEWAKECFRVLKPGGYMLSFCAARMYHRMTVGLEDAGFEIRDQIMWIYSSGFPKSQDIGRSIQRSLGVKETKKVKDDGSKAKHYDYGMKANNENEMVIATDPEAKAWSGWGTSLKPAHEPICLARKPMKLSIAKNVQQWGTGALNIDATRIPFDFTDNPNGMKRATGSDANTFTNFNPEHRINKDGAKNNDHDLDDIVYNPNDKGRFPSNVLGEIPDYQKYFYCPKVSRKERHMGFDDLPSRLCGPGGDDFVQAQDHQRSNQIISQEQMVQEMGGYFVDEQGQPMESRNGSQMLWTPSTNKIYIHGLKHEYEKWCKANGKELKNVGNNHPTVKPVALMEYLIKLITPPGGTVLDPFNGSGSTGMAAAGLGFNYIGIDLDENYIAISRKRIEAWLKQDEPPVNPIFETLFE